MSEINRINRNGITIVMEPCEAVAIYDNIKDRHVCHIKQRIVSKYPTRQFGSTLSTGLFDNSEGEVKEYENYRHTLVKIPSDLKPGDEKAIQDRLNQFKGTIQRIVSHDLDDVLTDGDRWAIQNGIEGMSREELADKYETRDSDGNRYSRGTLRVSSDGEVMDETLPAEYSRRVYQNSFVEDVDFRGSNVVISTNQKSDTDAEISIGARKGKLVS